MGPGLKALLIIGGGIAFLATQILYGKLSDRYGREPIMVLGATGLLGLLLAIGFGLLQAGPGADRDALTASVLSLWPVLVLFALLAVAFPPAGLAALADVGQEGKKSITMSLYTLVLAAGMIIGPPTAGLAQDRFGPWGVLLFFTILATFTLTIVAGRYIAGRLQPPEEPPRGPASEA